MINRFRGDPREYPRILDHDLRALQSAGNRGCAAAGKPVAGKAFAICRDRQRGPGMVAERTRDKEVHKRLWPPVCGHADIAQFVRRD